MAKGPNITPFPLKRRGYSSEANAYIAPEKHEQIVDIYAVRCGIYVKIGISSNTVSRMNGMACDNPFPIKLIAVAKCPAYLAGHAEHAAHTRLALHHHRREWFECSDAKARNAIAACVQAARANHIWYQAAPTKPMADFDTSFSGQGKFPFDFKMKRA